MLFSSPPSPCQSVASQMFAGCQLWVKRDDLLHAEVSGNKFRKLKYPLLALRGRRATLVTMGGPWSNHLHALAHAGALFGCPTIGLVRGAAGVDTATLAGLLAGLRGRGRVIGVAVLKNADYLR